MNQPPGNPYGFQQYIQQLVAQARQEFDGKINSAFGATKAMQQAEAQRTERRLADMQQVLDGVRLGMARSGGGGGSGGDIPRDYSEALNRKTGGHSWDGVIDGIKSGLVRIEDIPGRRIAFDLSVDIRVASGITSELQESTTISQDGPFVAVARYATFQSLFQFRQTFEDTTTAVFAGRSYGRFRPIHSAWDLGDANFPAASNFLPPGASASLTTTSSASSFRTMELDGRIKVVNAGSSFPRQNQSVPSSLWTPQINSPQDLGCLDFFERGEVITWSIQPTHVNNPPAGNFNGLNWLGVAGFPFLEGQFDPHEGIITPEPFSDDDPLTGITVDPITRLPDGILTIGYIGYRIQQPVAPVR